MKLYHRFPRLRYLRYANKRRQEKIRWALTLKPGDLINDCSGFNVVIHEVEPDYWRSPRRRGWAITNVYFTLDPHGSCSLLHCGVEPARPRDELEAEFLANYGHPTYVDQLRQWYGDHWPDFNEHTAKLSRQLETLRAGGHILDERGILLRP